MHYENIPTVRLLIIAEIYGLTAAELRAAFGAFCRFERCNIQLITDTVPARDWESLQSPIQDSGSGTDERLSIGIHYRYQNY